MPYPIQPKKTPATCVLALKLDCNELENNELENVPEENIQQERGE
jgi:hypothetical protein